MTHYTRLLSPPSGSFFLFGPRGTGKSTWLHATFPDSVYIDLLDSVAYRQQEQAGGAVFLAYEKRGRG